MLSVADAEAIIFDLARPLSREIVPLTAAGDRVLAVPVTSPDDVPRADNSAMDGYALRAADVSDCSSDQPRELEIVEEIPAGYRPQASVLPGQAARIFTGGVLPSGADAIAIQENVRCEGDRIWIEKPVAAGTFVRAKAAFYRAGTPLLMPGTALGPAELAVLATARCVEVNVYCRPRVAIFSTGDELVAPDAPDEEFRDNLAQVVDSNQYALAHFVAQMGGEPTCLGIVRDRPEDLRATMAEALEADVVLSTGGVSVGDYDYVDAVLAELGGTLHVRSVGIKPGKPLTVASFDRSEDDACCLYFGIPGNPVSALASCWRFVGPVLRKLGGRREQWQPTFVTARTLRDLQGARSRETYLWGRWGAKGSQLIFAPAAGSHSSGNLVNLAGTNGLAVVPQGCDAIAAGDEVRVLCVGAIAPPSEAQFETTEAPPA